MRSRTAPHEGTSPFRRTYSHAISSWEYAGREKQENNEGNEQVADLWNVSHVTPETPRIALRKRGEGFEARRP